ncbi:MAG: type II toxin-antitoxin system PemK/MazF family toxin [Burkholderiales bacterium]|nr:type II toxin-antitoxin system PemK/MazF family toxin [Burkholderiales bacterium]
MRRERFRCLSLNACSIGLIAFFRPLPGSSAFLKPSGAAEVLTTEPFNRMGLILAAPITRGGGFARDAGFAASLIGSGTQTQGVILAHQIRMLDWRARRAKFIERAPEDLTADVLARISTLLE